jgi:hypothetical protein
MKDLSEERRRPSQDRGAESTKELDPLLDWHSVVETHGAIEAKAIP